MKQTLISLCALLCASMQIATAQPLQRVAPEEVGIDSRRLIHADNLINDAIHNEEIPGAVLAVVRQGKMAYLKAYGNRRVYPYTDPMTTSTIFDMASCSKSMSTAVCAMVLVDQGKIRLTDAVSTYIPGFENWKSEDGKSSRTIRVKHLLTHTSGLPAYAPAATLEKEYGSPHPEGLMKYISTCKRNFEPESDFAYSCLNYITLQHIIENVSGLSLRDFARKHVFDVLGMDHTDYLPCVRNKKGEWVNTSAPHWAEKNDAAAYADVAPTERQPNDQVLCGQVHDPLARIMNGGISGNAGVFTTADDVAVLCAALQNGGEWNGKRILSPAAVRLMRSVPLHMNTYGRTPGWDCHSAYASNSGDLMGPHTYGHTGYTGTSIVIDPDNDLSIVLLINAVHPKDEHGVVRLRSLVANAVTGSVTGCKAPYTPHYYKRFVQFMDEAPITPDNIVMLGNSLTEGGGDWGKRLGKEGVVNRGIIGDEVMGVYDRLHQILPGKPKKLFLLIGVNDISHDLSADSIVTLIDKCVQRIRCESPDTKLYLQSLLPINESFKRYKRLTGKTPMVPEINAKLKELARRSDIKFINLYPLFTTQGTDVLRPELTSDGLHLNDEGYNIWVKALKKHI